MKKLKNKSILNLDKILGKIVTLKKTKGVDLTKKEIEEWANGPKMIIERSFSFDKNNLKGTLYKVKNYLKEKIKISEMNIKFMKKYSFIYHPNAIFIEKLEYKNLKSIEKSIIKFINN